MGNGVVWKVPGAAVAVVHDGALDEPVFIQPQGNVPAKRKSETREAEMKDAA